MLNTLPSKNDINKAREKISGWAHRTPLLTSKSINKITNAEIYFKCENFQKAGAFKFRGAANSILSLNGREKNRGVATHSSGNHAGALALAAKLLKIKAYVVMPETAPQIKVNAVKEYGAEIIFCKPTLKAREESLKQVVENTGAVFIHPYNNYSVIAGQATAAAEILEDITSPDYIITPVGGGGLLSGTALSANYFNPSVKIIGAEPENADDAFRSILEGKIIPSVNPHTICDGLLTSLGEKTFPIIEKYAHEIITVPDNITISAMRLVFERMKIIIEPSSAVGLAAVLLNPGKFCGKKISIIFSGGNIQLEKVSKYFNKDIK